jgi:hypothetical protein
METEEKHKIINEKSGNIDIGVTENGITKNQITSFKIWF